MRLLKESLSALAVSESLKLSTLERTCMLYDDKQEEEEAASLGATIGLFYLLMVHQRRVLIALKCKAELINVGG